MCSLSKWLLACLALLFIIVLSVVVYVIYQNDAKDVPNADTLNKHLEDLEIRAKGQIEKALDQVAAK